MTMSNAMPESTPTVSISTAGVRKPVPHAETLVEKAVSYTHLTLPTILLV